MATKKPDVDYRSADTGRYVDKGYADKHPKTTVKETTKPSPKGPPPKKGK